MTRLGAFENVMQAGWGLAFAASALVALAAGAMAGEAPPSQEPILKIEAGMHTAPIRRIGIDDDRSLLLTGSNDKTGRLWSLPDGRLLQVLRPPVGPGEGGSIRAAALSPDGTLAALGGWDAYYDVGQTHYIYLFNTATGAMAGRLGPLPNVVHELEFSPDGYYLVAGLGRENGIRVFDVPSRNETFADKDYGSHVYGISFAEDGRLATTSYDGKVRLYSPELKLLRSAATKGGKNPSGIAFSPDGSEIAVGFVDTRSIDILSADTLKRLASPVTKGVDNGNLVNVAWSNDGQTLYATGRWRRNDEQPIIGWSKRGRGPLKIVGSAADTILDMVGGRIGELAFAAADPMIAIFENGRQTLLRDRVSADMRAKRGDDFKISGDASRVRFGFDYGGGEPWLFDLGMSSFADSAKAPRDLHAPDVDGLKLTDWMNGTEPKLNGKKFEISTYDNTRAVAVTPGRASFVVGSDFALALYDRNGKQLWTRPVPGAGWGVNVSSDGKLIVAAYGDGTVRWHRLTDGAELLALFAHRETHEWVAWTPKGYYTTSPGGEKLICWHVNRRSWDEAADFFPADRFRSRFYRPDIIERVLPMGDEAAAISAANAEANRKDTEEDVKKVLPPVIEILSPAEGGNFSSPDQMIRYQVRSPSGMPIAGVDVLIDGRPLEMRGLARVEPPASEGVAAEIAVTLPERDVEVALIARTDAAASVPAKVALHWQGMARDMMKPKLYAVLVGVSDYQRSDLKLNYANRDALDLDAALKKQAGGLYREVDTKLLVDGDATADNIRDALDWLEHEVTSQDVALLFLAGHGVTDEKLRFYYLPVDVDPDRLRATAIPESGIRDVIGGIAGKVLFMVDACHSAEGLGDRQSRGGSADITSIVNEFAAAENGIVMFASSTGREVSVEDKAWQNGAFTEALIEGLEGQADITKDGSLTTAELGFWLSERVKKLTDGRQHPVVRRPDIMPDFPMALVEGQ